MLDNKTEASKKVNEYYLDTTKPVDLSCGNIIWGEIDHPDYYNDSSNNNKLNFVFIYI